MIINDKTDLSRIYLYLLDSGQERFITKVAVTAIPNVGEFMRFDGNKLKGKYIVREIGLDCRNSLLNAAFAYVYIQIEKIP